MKADVIRTPRPVYSIQDEFQVEAEESCAETVT